ncbi:MAG TPA: MMPL family transporter [Blastocatellia bacterium]|nr:MMPL family transporter [Blastocatellia bacterium]
MNQILKLIVFHPKIIIALSLALSALFAACIAVRGISFNGSPETLTRKDQELEFFNEVRTTFGDDRVIIVALTTTDVFTPEFIEKLDRLTTLLKSVNGVSDAISLTNLQAARRDGEGIRVESLIPRPATVEHLQKLKQEVTSDPLYARHYISEDGRTTALNVFINPRTEAETRRIAEEVESVMARVEEAEAGTTEVLLAGVPIMNARGMHSMARDLLVCSPVAAFLCFVVFLFAFRSFWGAALPMMALGMGLVWVFGLMSLFGRPITIATLVMPTILMAVGSSYIFHVLNQYRLSMSEPGATESSDARRRSWLEGLKFIGPAVLVSGTTTMAGFGALASSDIPTVFDAGVFQAAGVMFMLLLSLAFIPAALALLPPRALGQARQDKKDYALWLNGWLRTITAFILFRRRTVLAISLLLTAAIGAGVLWLRINTDYLNIFPSQSDTVQDAERLHERMAGAASVQIIVTGARGAIADPAFMSGIDRLEEFALNQPGVDAALSISDIVKRLNSLLPGEPGQPAAEIPQDPARLRSINDDFLSQDETIQRLVSRDGSRVIILLRTNLFASNDLRGLTTRIDEWSRENLPPGAVERATGSFVLLNDASDAVAVSQASSLAIALASIYLMMVILFRSFATGLLALIPNLLPIACYFGFLGWTGITLDITTSMVASGALGLAVDNAVHMIRRFRQATAERPDDEGWAMWLTMHRTGKPTVLVNLTLTIGFLVFVLSSFLPVRLSGVLWAVTILACLAADLIFLPALMKTQLFARIARGHSKKREPDKEPEYVNMKR